MRPEKPEECMVSLMMNTLGVQEIAQLFSESEEYQKVVHMLFLWEENRLEDDFHVTFFDLCREANRAELAKLSVVFPLLVGAWRAWNEAETEGKLLEFFTKNGVDVSG